MLYADNNRLTIQVDNDLLFGTDRQYTGGLKLLWTADQQFLVNSLFSTFDKTWLENNHVPITSTQDQVEFASEIYMLQHDSPQGNKSLGNTAWVYFDLRRFYQMEQDKLVFSTRLGLIGPDNHGEDIQNGIHALIGNDSVPSWDKQPPNRVTFQVSADYQNNLYASEGWHLFYSLNSVIGFPATAISAGLGAYYAKHVEPVFCCSGLNHFIPLKHEGGWFVYSYANVRHEFYNGFFDEDLFGDNTFVLEKNNLLIPSIEYGGGYAFQKVSIGFHGTSMGQVYRGQSESIFRFASLTLSFPL